MPSNSHDCAPVVYLIDDDENDVIVVRRICESVGLTVQAYSSPVTFLRHFDPESQGCIVADLMMPEMTGLQLHEELQRVGSRLPILVVTGHADARTCRTAWQKGVFDFVEKSVDSHDLLVAIRAGIAANQQDHREQKERTRGLCQLASLSPREKEVTRLLVDGMSLKDIASHLGISVQTASKHRIRLFSKLGIDNEVALLKLLYRIDPSNPGAAAASGESNPLTLPVRPESLSLGPAPAAGNG